MSGVCRAHGCGRSGQREHPAGTGRSRAEEGGPRNRRPAGADILNRAARLDRILDRDGPTCIWCGRPFSALVTPTTEHVVPRVKGGPSWLENEVAACRRCNGERGHRSPVDWLDDCLGRGWAADPGRLARIVADLERAIGVRGGQRRARVYLASVRRRLQRWAA